MKMNAFDDMLELKRRHMTAIEIDAVVDVNDALQFAMASAENVFAKGKFTPADVIALCALMLDRLPAKRQRKAG